MSFRVSSVEKFNTDFLSILPDDVKIDLIYEYCNFENWSQISLINKKFSELYKTPFLWFKIAEKFNIEVAKETVPYEKIKNYFNAFYNLPSLVSVRTIPKKTLIELRQEPLKFLEILGDKTQEINKKQKKYNISSELITSLFALGSALVIYKSTKTMKKHCLNIFKENLNNKEHATFYKRMKESKDPDHQEAALLLEQIAAATLSLIHHPMDPQPE